MPDDPKATAMIAVKNVSRGPVSLDGGGMLAPGEDGNAADSEHTAALIDAGLLIAMPAETAAEKKGREKAEAEALKNTPPDGEGE